MTVFPTQISTIEETKSTEVVTMRNAYHAELEQLRRALDDTAKERARYQVRLRDTSEVGIFGCRF